MLTQVDSLETHADDQAGIGSTLTEPAPITPSAARLIEEHLPLVRQVASKMKSLLPAFIDEDDLCGAGIKGLIAAAQKFESVKENTFFAYAKTRIRGAMLDELRKCDPLTRLARTRTKLIRETTARIEQEKGSEATEAELAAALGIDLERLARWRFEAQPISFVQIEHPGCEENQPVYAQVADETIQTGRDLLERSETASIMAEKIEQMPEMPRRVLAMYYYEGMRFCEIAKTFDLTESRICQIHAKALDALKTQIVRAREK